VTPPRTLQRLHARRVTAVTPKLHPTGFADVAAGCDLPVSGAAPTAARAGGDDSAIGLGPAVDGSQRVDFENEDYFGFRWWLISEIVGSGDRFYPGRLPTLLPAFLAGEQIEEPFEVWS
jgi:hypothetical protein